MEKFSESLENDHFHKDHHEFANQIQVQEKDHGQIYQEQKKCDGCMACLYVGSLVFKRQQIVFKRPQKKEKSDNLIHFLTFDL